MGYFEEMMRRSQRQDARTRNAQLTLEQISGLAPTNAEIAVQTGQAALQHYVGLLDRARAKKAADESAQAKRQEAKQAVIDKRKEWLYGKVLDRGGALPEDFAGMPEGYTLPEKPDKPAKPIVRTVHDPSGYYFVEQDPNSGQVKVIKAPGVEGKKISSTLAYYMARDEDRAEVDAAEKEYKTGMDRYKIDYTKYKADNYVEGMGWRKPEKRRGKEPQPPDWNAIIAKYPRAAKLSKTAPQEYDLNIFGEQPTAVPANGNTNTFDI
jgi:hypothetical protein